MRKTLRLTSTQAFLKRSLDLVLTSVSLVLIAPLLLAISLGVKLSGPGPILYRYRRFGPDGKSMHVYKFRTMLTTENYGIARWATSSDPRITPFGAFLRLTALDELPSLVSVLRGDMSIVGPRPKHAYEFEYYKAIAKENIELRPGITSASRGYGYASGPNDPEAVKVLYEQEKTYVENWSVWLDLKIIGQTVRRGLFDSNAY